MVASGLPAAVSSTPETPALTRAPSPATASAGYVAKTSTKSTSTAANIFGRAMSRLQLALLRSSIQIRQGQ